MTTAMQSEQRIDLKRSIDIQAPIGVTFEALLEELGPESQMPDGTSMHFKLEAWPGGRWYRDLGNNTGHLWGHVQVIKPPKLLEICGPLFMSYPALNFVQYRLTEQDQGTQLTIVHRAIGEIKAEDRDGVVEGWEYELNHIKEIAERNSGRRPK